MSGLPLLTPIPMDPNYASHLRIFREVRFHPWDPTQKKFIDGELAKMDITNPEEAKDLRVAYERKMAEYEQKQESVQNIVEEVTKDGEVTMEDLAAIIAAKEAPVEVEEDKPKKRRKSKSSPTDHVSEL